MPANGRRGFRVRFHVSGELVSASHRAPRAPGTLGLPLPQLTRSSSISSRPLFRHLSPIHRCCDPFAFLVSTSAAYSLDTIAASSFHPPTRSRTTTKRHGTGLKQHHILLATLETRNLQSARAQLTCAIFDAPWPVLSSSRSTARQAGSPVCHGPLANSSTTVVHCSLGQGRRRQYSVMECPASQEVHVSMRVPFSRAHHRC